MGLAGLVRRVVGLRVQRDRDVPEPRRARPCLPRGLDTALSAVTKWRRGPVASVSCPSRLGVSVLCAGHLESRLPTARSFGFCRLCWWALVSAPEFSSPLLARPPGPSSPQVRPFSGLGPSGRPVDSAAVAIAPRAVSLQILRLAAPPPRLYLPQGGRGVSPPPRRVCVCVCE